MILYHFPHINSVFSEKQWCFRETVDTYRESGENLSDEEAVPVDTQIDETIGKIQTVRSKTVGQVSHFAELAFSQEEARVQAQEASQKLQQAYVDIGLPKFDQEKGQIQLAQNQTTDTLRSDLDGLIASSSPEAETEERASPERVLKQVREKNPEVADGFLDKMSQVTFEDIVDTLQNLTPAQKTDLIADMTPLVGDYKGGAEAFWGESLIAGSDMAWWEQIISGLSATPVLGTPFDVVKVLEKVAMIAVARKQVGGVLDKVPSKKGGEAVEMGTTKIEYATPEPNEFNELIKMRQTEGGSLSVKSEEFLRNSIMRVSEDGKTGFGLTKPDKDGVMELFNVFSLERGRGKKLMLEAIREAKKQGAKKIRLDAFEVNSEGANLKKFYEKAGFREFRREKNWTDGGTDVIFMERIL